MGIFGDKNKLKNGVLIAVFDIASASVGGLLFRTRKNGAPEVLASIRQPANFQGAKNFQTAWRLFHQAFVSVEEYLKKSGGGRPETVLCVFSSPWYVSQTKIIKVRKQKSFDINERLINDLIKEEMAEFQKRWQGPSFSENSGTIFFENEPLKAVLNGYDVADAFGKKARSLDLYIYLGMSLEMLKKKIEEEILHFMKPHSVLMHTFPFLIYKILKNIINTEEGLILADITGEISDVFLIRDNVMEEVNSFSKGENFFIKRLASGFNLDYVQAKALFSQYERDELSQNYTQKVAEILAPAGKEWGKALSNLLKEMSKEKLLPQNFYFCGPAGSIKEISGQVGGEGFSEFTVLGKPFNVGYILPEAMQFHFDFTKGLSSSKDVFLLISALYASKFL